MLTFALKLLPAILQLMGVAESIFDKGAGAQKKEMVTVATKAIVGGVATVSTGGQAETWERISEPVSNVIDGLATIAFPKE